MATEPIYTLTVYEDDDTTVLFTVSTDPAAVDPEKAYMKAPRDYAEQEVDFAKGAASIGQVTVEVVDVPTDPADQDTGWLTDLLADANGNSQCNGHRARLTEDFGSGPELIMDGVIRSVRLLDTFATYALELRDIRERERKTKSFERTTTPTVLPRGVLNGYGRPVPTLTGSTRHPVPPTRPIRATYFSTNANVGTLDLTEEIPDKRRVTAAVRTALEHTAPLDGVSGAYIFDRWKLLWKPRGSASAYTEITQLAHTHPSLPSGGGTGWQGEGTGTVLYMRVDNLVSGATLPTDEQEVDIIIQYDGPVSEEWPLHINDLTVGELLRNLYRGDYSNEDPRIRYDESALLALTTPVRARFTEPVDDLRAWAEKNAYPIAHAAPTLDSEGRISPVTYLLPDASETVPSLGDSTTKPVGGGWSHGSEDSVNVVTVSYFEDYLAAESETDEGARIPVEDRVRSTEVGHQSIDAASLALLGWNEIEIKSELLRAVGPSSLIPFFGDIVDQGALQVAKRAANALLDRFSCGGQYIEVMGLRSDSDVESIRVGSYRVLGQSWMPDYLSGTRGLSRLGQCVRRRNVNAAWCALTFVDAGSGAAPLGQPTLGTLSSDDDGVVTIPVSALASGDPFARVDYAVNDTEPSPGSQLWTFLDRVDATGDLTTPPLGQDQTVWVRARSEAQGRRPSAYTTPDSVTTSAVPRLVQVELEVDPATGVVTVRWEPNESCEGVRLHFERHRSNETPAYGDTEDVDAADGEYSFTALPLSPGDVLSVRLEPFPTWTGSAVSGTAGPIVDVSTQTDDAPEPTVEELTFAFNPSGELVVRVRAAEAGSVRILADGTDFPTASEVGAATLRTLDSNGWFELNLGSGFPDVEVFIGSQAYENTDGSGIASPLKVSKVAAAEYGLFEGGTVGGWEIDASEIKATGGGFTLNSSTKRLLIGAATAVLTGVGIFAGDVGDGTFDLRAGDPAAEHFHWDESEGTVDVAGTIEADAGSFGGWEITPTDIVSPGGNIRLESDTERILLGDATAPLVGAGGFFGESGGVTQLRVGDPGGDYFLYNGSVIVLGGQIVQGSNLVDGAVDSLQLADEAVTTAKLFDGAATSAKIGDEAVVAAKLANYAVGSRTLDGTARSQHGVFMETFETLVTADWGSGSSPGTESLVTGAGVSGGNVYQAVGQRWRVFPENIPYDPSKLYRIRGRFRVTSAPTTPTTARVYLGVEGVAANGTTRINVSGADSQSSQHYVGGAGSSAAENDVGNWVELSGWFSGHATSGVGSSNNSATNPAPLYDGVAYFRPLFIVNYNSGDGTTQVDYLVVDVFDEDGLVRSYLGLNVDGVVAADKVVAASIDAGAVESDAIATRALLARHLFVGSFDNLVRNPGFEQTNTGYNEWSHVAGGGSWSVVTSNARSGGNAVQYDPSGQTADSRLQNSTTTAGVNTDGIAVDQGTRILAEAYVRKVGAGSANNARVVVSWRSRTGSAVSTSAGTSITPTTSYQRIAVEAVAPSGAAQAVIELQVLNNGNSELILFDDVYARRMVEGSIMVDGTLTAVHIASLSFSGKSAVFDTGSVGGWLLSATTLTSGNVTIDASAERILMGSATAPMTGIGVFIGEDGAGGYDLRAGDPAGDYLWWDASSGTLTVSGTIDVDAIVAAESFTATTPVFTGSVDIEGGRGDPVVSIVAAGVSGVRGEIRVYTSTDIVGVLESVPGGMLIDSPSSANGGILALDAGTEIQIRQNILPLSNNAYDVGSSSERFAEGHFDDVFADIVDTGAVHVGSGAAGVPPSGRVRLYWDGSALRVLENDSTLHEIAFV